MKVIKLSNPLDSAISAKFLTGNGADISTFPKMEKILLEDVMFIGYVMPNYIKIDSVIYKVVCSAWFNGLTAYITTETGQIIEILKDNSLGFINFTQIQTIGLRAGFKI